MQHNKLEILHLTKRFGEKTLFEDLNLTVEEPAVLWAPQRLGQDHPPARPHGAGNAYLRQCAGGGAGERRLSGRPPLPSAECRPERGTGASGTGNTIQRAN